MRLIAPLLLSAVERGACLRGLQIEVVEVHQLVVHAGVGRQLDDVGLATDAHALVHR